MRIWGLRVRTTLSSFVVLSLLAVLVPVAAIGVTSDASALMRDAASGLLRLLGTCDTPSYANGVAVSGTTAYVADVSSGLQVIDVGDPAAPALLGTYYTPNQAYGVAVAGTTAYVADWDSGLQVIDVSDPAAPALLGDCDTPGSARGVAVSGAIAYVADSGSGLQVIYAPYRTGQIATVAVEGADRFATAVEASKLAYPAGAETVVLATGENWPDALGGSALAGAVDGPLLLVRATSMPDSTKAEIGRLKAKKAYVLGGSGAVEDVVVAQLKTMLGAGNVIQLEGPTRYETAQKVATEAIRLEGVGFGGHAFVARGDNYPDALAASPLAAAWRAPIILARPGTVAPTLPPEVTSASILGQVDVVSGAIETALKNKLGAGKVERLGGATRYETAALIAQAGIAGGLIWDGLAIATGENFPDALSGGVLCAKRSTVMLLTRTASLPAPVGTCLAANRGAIGTVRFLGGTTAVSPAVRTAIEQVLEQ
jgi:putative cell wall-binding protein